MENRQLAFLLVDIGVFLSILLYYSLLLCFSGFLVFWEADVDYFWFAEVWFGGVVEGWGGWLWGKMFFLLCLEYSVLVKKFKFFFKNILSVLKKVVLLHPLSTENGWLKKLLINSKKAKVV